MGEYYVRKVNVSLVGGIEDLNERKMHYVCVLKDEVLQVNFSLAIKMPVAGQNDSKVDSEKWGNNSWEIKRGKIRDDLPCANELIKLMS